MSAHITFTKSETNNLGVQFYTVVSVQDDGTTTPIEAVRFKTEETAELRDALNAAAEKTDLPIDPDTLARIEAHEERHGLVDGLFPDLDEVS